MNTINDGGPAFPQPVAFSPNGEAVTAGMYFAEGPGMSLRDWFARNTPHDEVCEMTYRHLSRLAQEKLAGIPYPVQNREAKGGDVVDQQIAIMHFHAKVSAALRYISADAMLAAREINQPQ